MVIRPATLHDAPTLAALSGELGYPATTAQLAARLAPLLAAPERHRVLVAELHGRVQGWIHGLYRELLESEPSVEIGGLVVAADARGHGVGAALLTACEAWARTLGVAEIGLRSRQERHDAHRFYQRHGYRHVKTQLALRKAL